MIFILKRCHHPYTANDSYSTLVSHLINETLNSNITELTKCNYKLANETVPCNKWVFDKTYYKTSLTEDVIYLIIISLKIFDII